MMINFRYLITTLFLFAVGLNIPNAGYGVTAGKCLTSQSEGNRITFHCENHIDVMVEQYSPDIFKIWYDTDGFKANNGSFAVVESNFSSNEKLNTAETPQGVEIYTSTLIVRINKDPFRIQFFDKYQKVLVEDFGDKGFVKDEGSMTSYKSLRPNEAIYGLGEKNGPLNRRGMKFRMWNSDKPCYSTSEDPLYKSIPFFFSNYGYGIFFDNTYKSTFDFGASSPDYYTFGTPGGEMIYYFMYGPSPRQIIKNYIQLTGKPILPPSWSLGFAQCRGLLTNEALTRDIAKGYRERQIPCDIIYQDIGWTNYLQNFEWRKGNYTDPVKMLSDLEKEGFKVIVSQDPVISQENKSQWEEADKAGFFTTDTRTGKSYNMPWPWGGNCGVVDFTNPKVADWWGNYQQKPIEAGVRGFWTDMGEPAWSNEENGDRLFMRHYLGLHEEIHNVYGLTWDKVVTEQFEKHNPNTRIFQMTRSAYSGMQRYTFGWSGDTGNGEDVTKGWGQLEAQIPVALSAGMCGIPFWSCDISGYCGDIKDYQAESELYVRWLQFGAFNPLSRIHHEGNNAVEPWLFGAEAEKLCKEAIELKYHLFPYIYTLAHEARENGIPLMRAMSVEFPDDKNCENCNTQFMFGESMLVAPVTEEGATVKKVYLPKGTWIDYNDRKIQYEGGKWIDYPVELKTIPIFIKGGVIIPTMPVEQYIGQHAGYPLIMEIFPAGINKKASTSVYEDDGESNNYRKGIYGVRIFNCLTHKDRYEINCQTVNENNYQLKERSYIIKIQLEKVPLSVVVGGIKIKQSKGKSTVDPFSLDSDKATWNWDKSAGLLTILLPSTLNSKLVTIEK